MSNEMGRKRRRTFSTAFKEEAIRRVRKVGNINAVAKELGVTPSAVSAWVKEAEHKEALASAGAGSSNSELEAENRRLREKIARLEEEKEILKKATAFFARENE